MRPSQPTPEAHLAPVRLLPGAGCPPVIRWGCPLHEWQPGSAPLPGWERSDHDIIRRLWRRKIGEDIARPRIVSPLSSTRSMIRKAATSSSSMRGKSSITEHHDHRLATQSPRVMPSTTRQRGATPGSIVAWKAKLTGEWVLVSGSGHRARGMVDEYRDSTNWKTLGRCPGECTVSVHAQKGQGVEQDEDPVDCSGHPRCLPG